MPIADTGQMFVPSSALSVSPAGECDRQGGALACCELSPFLLGRNVAANDCWSFKPIE